MKVATIVGTRPEIIRLSPTIEKLDALCDHVFVHTGQNYAPELSAVFFEELGVRQPDHHFGVRAETAGEQIGRIMVAVDSLLREVRPERLLVLGDTNSALSTLIAKRLGITTFHMEAGNRCFDDRVPEEVNRRVVDHASDALMPYTERSRANLLREGIASDRIHVIGNPIYEVLQRHRREIDSTDVLERLGVESRKYFLVTMHREENVDDERRLRSLVASIAALRAAYGLPVICSTHPRTRDRIARFEISDALEDVLFATPFGFFDFVALEQAAFCVLSDSGTVQEECCIFRTPNVTIRDVTERPETIESGSNMLSGVDAEDVLRCVRTVLHQEPSWRVPPEYLVKDVSSTVTKIVLGHEPAGAMADVRVRVADLASDRVGSA